MSALQEELDERTGEVRRYFDFLECALAMEPRVRFRCEAGYTEESISDDVQKVLKATVFLLMYNLVEATFRRCVDTIGESIERAGIDYKNARNEIRDLFIDSVFRRADPFSSNLNTHKETTRFIVSCIIESSAINLASSDIKFGGNLDARRIRELAAEYGLSLVLPDEAKGGEKLRVVKEKRNGLAHGELMFTECGRDYDLSQLKDIFSETTFFLNGVINSLQTYLNGKQFLRDSAA